jgi:phosphoheptose isomerase
MKEPKLYIESLELIRNTHTATVQYGFESINQKQFQEAADCIVNAIYNGKTIFTVGNGASAAIAQHWACDYTKGCRPYGNPRVISLSTNIPLMTAISNDISYDEVYAYQVNALGDWEDVLITISSSGNSPNVVRAIEAAKKRNMKTIALTGFQGGKSRELADYPIHVDVQEYEAAEDVHQAIMHMIAKYIRVVL